MLCNLRFNLVEYLTPVRRHRRQITEMPNNGGTKQQGWQRAAVEKILVQPEVAGVTFSDTDSAPVSNFESGSAYFSNLRIRLLLQTPATIIILTVIYPCSYLRNDHTDSCQCRNGKVTPDPGPVFHKFLTPVPSPNEKRRILRESTPVVRIRSQIWFKHAT